MCSAILRFYKRALARLRQIPLNKDPRLLFGVTSDLATTHFACKAQAACDEGHIASDVARDSLHEE
jgi:hypothetical protein